jgi:hypothetical protein
MCVRPLTGVFLIETRPRCRAAQIRGLRAANVAVQAPARARGSVEVSVELAAVANLSRRTLVVQYAVLSRRP